MIQVHHNISDESRKTEDRSGVGHVQWALQTVNCQLPTANYRCCLLTSRTPGASSPGMKQIFCLFAFILCLSGAFGQDYKKIDSLKQVLTTLPALNGTDADTVRMRVSLELGSLYEYNFPDTAIWYYESIIDNMPDEYHVIRHPKRARYCANAMRYEGIIYYNQGRFSDALNLYNNATTIAKALGDMTMQAKTYISIGLVYWQLGSYNEAKSFFLKATELSKETQERGLMSKCLNNLGLIESDMGKFSDALSYFALSLEIEKEFNNKEGVSRCLNNIGAVNINLGNYPEAMRCIEQSLQISRNISESNTARCLANLSDIATKSGDFPNAISYLEQSLQIKEKIGDLYGISICLNYLGIINYQMSNFNEAIRYQNESLKVSEKLMNKKGILNSTHNLGLAYEELGRYSEAKAYYLQSLKIADSLQISSATATIYNSYGGLLKKEGNISEALVYFEKSLSIANSTKDQRLIAMCLGNIGVVYDEINNADYESYYYHSLEIFEDLKAIDELIKIYSFIGGAKIKRGYYEDAHQFLRKSNIIAMDLLKENFAIMSEQDKELFLSKSKEIVNLMHLLNLLNNDLSDSLSITCYTNEIIFKGLLLKSTSIVLDAVYNSSDTSLQNTFWLLKQYRNEISTLMGTDDVSRDSLIADIEQKANEQERKLVRLSSEFANIQKLFDYKWEDVKKNLKTGEAAIEFISFTKGNENDTTVYAALVITPESRKPISIKLFEDNELQKLLGKYSGTDYEYINTLYEKNSTALYNLIWKPLEPTLAGITTVYYSPVGVLNKISFAALSKEPGKMLCDIYNLQQVSTTGKLINKEDAKEMKMTAAVFGGIDYNTDTVKLEAWKYLHGTLNEKNSIEKQLKKNKISCHTFSGKEAKEETFKALFDSSDAPSILHVSTHGFFYPDPETTKKDTVKEENTETGQLAFRGSSGFGNWMFLNNKNPMMRSGLVFAGANRVWSEDWGRTDNEGVLTAYEVSNMNMRNTDLVVLSACETGLGDIKGSEGVYGLQRAFKMAGVKYIIMSLWQVPDKETVEFMETFYKKLLKSKDVRKSFNETQKEMRKKYDPYYWGAFVLIE